MSQRKWVNKSDVTEWGTQIPVVMMWPPQFEDTLPLRLLQPVQDNNVLLLGLPVLHHCPSVKGKAWLSEWSLSISTFLLKPSTNNIKYICVFYLKKKENCILLKHHLRHGKVQHNPLKTCMTAMWASLSLEPQCCFLSHVQALPNAALPDPSLFKWSTVSIHLGQLSSNSPLDWSLFINR